MSGSITRRHFLGHVACSGAAAGIVLGRGISWAEETPLKKVVVGVMGLSRGSSLAVSFARQPGVEVKYLCDVDSSRSKHRAEAGGYGGPSAGSSW